MRPLLLAIGSAVLVLIAPARALEADTYPNSLNLSLSYVYGPSDRIIESGDLDPIEHIPITHQAATLGVEYGTPLDRLSVEASLPLIGVKWDPKYADDTSDSMRALYDHYGADADGNTVIRRGDFDDGDTHFTVTDVRAGLRYEILQVPVSLSATVAGSIPTHDYPNFGFTAPARHLKALIGGLALTYVTPFRLYLSGQYEFSLGEKVDVSADTRKHSQNRSDVSASIGYFILDRLEVNVGFDGRMQHGGVGFAEFATLSADERNNHDALLDEDAYFVGGGLSYQLTDELNIGAAVRFYVGGQNTRDTNLFGAFASYQIL